MYSFLSCEVSVMELCPAEDERCSEVGHPSPTKEAEEAEEQTRF